MICPCKDCPKKGCGSYHDLCVEYNKYKRAKQKANKAERDDKPLHFFRKKRLFNKGDYVSYGKANYVEKND